MLNSLDVIIWDKKVGTLVFVKNGYKEQICFYYDPDYVKNGIDIAPLRAPLSSIVAQRGLPIFPDEDKIFGGLPSFIADSMPDHWGNVVFNEWARANKIRQKEISVLDRLAYIGRRGMGALEFVPPVAEAMEAPFKVEIIKLSQLAQVAMAEAKNFHAVFSPDFAIESLFKVGTSAGGRRPKAVINFNRDSGECYSGQVATPLPGFTPMIIKFDEHSDIPTTRVEYSYYLMALEADLKMMPSQLLECGGEGHFITERFDRRGTEKIHVQTLAAMNPLSSSYEDLFETAQRLEVPNDELLMLFRLMVMNVLAANIDDHNKNFSFIMDKFGDWHISPVYDFTFNVDLSAPHYVNRHSMTVNGKNQNIMCADLLALASRYNIKTPDAIINSAIGVVRNYRKYALQASVPEPWIENIENIIAERVDLLI